MSSATPFRKGDEWINSVIRVITRQTWRGGEERLPFAGSVHPSFLDPPSATPPAGWPDLSLPLVQDACLLNFSKTLRMSDDKHKQSEAYLKAKVAELEQREASNRMVHAEHTALITKHEKLLWIHQEAQEEAKRRIARAEEAAKVAENKRQAAEQAAQDRGRDAYEKVARADEGLEQARSSLRLEVESLKRALQAGESERRQVEEELEGVMSAARGTEERLARADAEIEELRAILASSSSQQQQGGGGGHTAEAEIVRLSCELERSYISVSEAKREAEMLRAHKRAREQELGAIEHRMSALQDDYRQLERAGQGEAARVRAVMRAGESQARGEVMMLREQLAMARAGGTHEAQAAFEREAMMAEVEELRGVVVGLEGRLALGEAQRARDREALVRGEQRVLSLEEKLRQSGEMEREAAARAEYLERLVVQKQEVESVRTRAQGVKEMAVEDLEQRLIMSRHEHQATVSSLQHEVKDLRARIAAKEGEARDFQQRSYCKEEELLRLTGVKAQAEALICQLRSEIWSLRRDLEAAMARPLSTRGISVCAGEDAQTVEELRNMLADRGIEVSNARDEARGLRNQLRESNNVLDEGKQHIVGLLKDVQKRDELIRGLKEEVTMIKLNREVRDNTLNNAQKQQGQHHPDSAESKRTSHASSPGGVKPMFPHRHEAQPESGTSVVLVDRTNAIIAKTRLSGTSSPSPPLCVSSFRGPGC